MNKNEGNLTDFIPQSMWVFFIATACVGITTTGVMVWAVVKLVTHFTN